MVFSGWLLVLAATLVGHAHRSSGSTVLVSYTCSNVTAEHQVPDEVNVTVATAQNATVQLQLTRVAHINFDIPVYLLKADQGGQYSRSRREITPRENKGFYQDVTNQAYMQIERQQGSDHNEVQLSFKGDFVTDGQVFTLVPPQRMVRDTITHCYMGYHLLAKKRKKLYFADSVHSYTCVWERFLHNTDNETAFQDLLEYYAFIFNGIDTRYKGIKSMDYTINVLLGSINILEIDTLFKNEDTDGHADAKNMLNTLAAFTISPWSIPFLYYDHVMLFTGLDLFDKVTKTDYLGISFNGSLCNKFGLSASVIEDKGDYSAMETATHELGHSLSANHDGEDNECKTEDRYIMAKGSLHENQGTELNPWLFSPCSIRSFTEHIGKLLKTFIGTVCLTTSLTTNYVFPNVSNRLLGQEIPPDHQCQLKHGNGSFYCKLLPDIKICTELTCFRPGKNDCTVHHALMGTSCGNKMVCKEGRCVHDDSALQVEGDCLFGDSAPGLFLPEPCPSLIKKFNGLCYAAGIERLCCASCRNISRPDESCKYGDNMANCSKANCHIVTGHIDCCESCSFPQSVIAAKPKVRSGVDTATEKNQCMDHPDSMTNISCIPISIMFPYLCYIEDVRAACCASCKIVNTKEQGCEYGT
ncbi:zinc metalloproteinase-disintegrin-like cobrin isoform X2 [Physella acuta]|uniref:zinc metalloproteinase-disintegrin-like cobrin isoform X2 n=1 Tax=Physella acuta TaxID=109671 RepID=UPI0027DDEE5D|nr:zinc metalloproteinase-disintegrin-like cobrin isoform X2 [Physella acuta]